MGVWEEQLPVIGMLSLEFIYAVMTLLNKQAMGKGLSPRILVFYRQTCATLVTFPIAFLSRRGSSNARMDLRLFVMIFIISFIGVTMFENFYIQGLHMTSSSITTAMFNLVPAITFLMATILRWEPMNVKRLSNIAKMLGTATCVGGAMAMTFLRGPKLLNAQALLLDTHNWVVGGLLLFAGVSCLSSWLILSVPITKSYPDYLSLSAWTCLLSMAQTGIVALFTERDPKAWVLTSSLEITACLFSGIFGTGAKYFIQYWCISNKGPIFVAIFSPLNTLIATTLASMFFHEEVYLGSLLGATIVIIGLYVFLWGKAEEMKENEEPESLIITTTNDTEYTINMDQPLLADYS